MACHTVNQSPWIPESIKRAFFSSNGGPHLTPYSADACLQLPFPLSERAHVPWASPRLNTPEDDLIPLPLHQVHLGSCFVLFLAWDLEPLPPRSCVNQPVLRFLVVGEIFSYVRFFFYLTFILVCVLIIWVWFFASSSCSLRHFHAPHCLRVILCCSRLLKIFSLLVGDLLDSHFF